MIKWWWQWWCWLNKSVKGVRVTTTTKKLENITSGYRKGKTNDKNYVYNHIILPTHRSESCKMK